MNAAHLDAGEYWEYSEIAAYLGVAEVTVRSYVSDYEPPFPQPAHPKAKLWKADDVRAWNQLRRGPDWRKGQIGSRDTPPDA